MNTKETTDRRLKAHRGLFLIGALALAAPGVQALAATTTYQSEDPAVAVIINGVRETTNPGFTGDGYVNYNNIAGSAVEFRVNAPQTGTYFINLNFANGTSARRPMDLSVNGRVVNARLPGDPTGAWSAWRNDGVNVELVAGANVVRLTALTSNGGPNLDRIDVTDQPAPSADWSRFMVESTMTRVSEAPRLGPWEYSRALYLYGQYLVWRRLGEGRTDHRYLQYIKSWVDSKVRDDGTIRREDGTTLTINSLDNMLPANLCLLMHRHFGDAKYKSCADRIRSRLMGSYLTSFQTTDGAVWHASSRRGQTWADGVFMSMPFVVRWGDRFSANSSEDNFAANQILLYAAHLRRPTGLLRHAWDDPEDDFGQQSWAGAGGQSPEHWCRAIGWFGMTLIEVLDVIPSTHARRPELLATLRALINGLLPNQERESGLWFQVVDKGSNMQNWHETSCSSMHAYTILRAVEKGYIADTDGTLRAAANKAHSGVLSKLSLGSDGLTNLSHICIGTNVGDLNFYFGRPRETNDRHGTGAFLIMNEAFRGNSGFPTP